MRQQLLENFTLAYFLLIATSRLAVGSYLWPEKEDGKIIFKFQQNLVLRIQISL